MYPCVSLSFMLLRRTTLALRLLLVAMAEAIPWRARQGMMLVYSDPHDCQREKEQGRDRKRVRGLLLAWSLVGKGMGVGRQN